MVAVPVYPERRQLGRHGAQLRRGAGAGVRPTGVQGPTGREYRTRTTVAVLASWARNTFVDKAYRVEGRSRGDAYRVEER